MNSASLTYKETGFFAKTILDYLDNAEPLRPFFNFSPTLEGLAQAAGTRHRSKIDRSLLVSVLKKQYDQLLNDGGMVSKETYNNIDRLSNDRALTVTTGHQLNIFGGPLYTTYKIATVIKLARKLSQSDSPVVPLFWMATEDHDFAEINHVNLADKKITWEGAPGDATGRLSTVTMAKALSAVLSSLGVKPFSNELLAICQLAYGSGLPLGRATRVFYNYFFSSYGLIILDPDDEELKKAFSPIMERDIQNAISFQQVTSTNKALEALGYKPSVHPREINFFYLGKERERLVRHEDGFQTVSKSKSWSYQELLDELHHAPSNFSPNVIMRPVFQEYVLPNVAYVGGGGEIAYWLSLYSTFLAHGVSYPVLLLRNSSLIIDPRSAKRIAGLGFKASDFFRTPRQLIADYVAKTSSHSSSLNFETGQLEAVMKKIEQKAALTDESLVKAVAAVQTRLIHLLSRLEKKIERAERNRFDTQMSQILKVKDKLFPGHELQERVENFLPYYAEMGPMFIETLIESFDVPSDRFLITNLETPIN